LFIFVFISYEPTGMKIIITESQYNRILKEEEEQKVLHIPSLKFFNDDWNLLQKFLKSKGNPPYSIGGNLYLGGTSIKSLGNLQSVGGDLDLYDTPIESLGNLTSVGGYLDLYKTPIESLGNLKSVGGFLNLPETPLYKMYTEKQIRKMVNVDGKIYL
jgi:hypothetical protein